MSPLITPLLPRMTVEVASPSKVTATTAVVAVIVPVLTMVVGVVNESTATPTADVVPVTVNVPEFWNTLFRPPA